MLGTVPGYGSGTTAVCVSFVSSVSADRNLFQGKAQARTLPEDMEPGFDDKGLHVRVGG